MNGALACYHCGEPVAAGTDFFADIGGASRPMCCIGCKSVAEFIAGADLGAYYAHRERPAGEPALAAADGSFRHFDEAELAGRYVHRDGGMAEATLDIGGMVCSACAWLLNGALTREHGVESVSVSPATRRAVVRWDAGRLRFSDVLQAVARVGFRPVPVGAGGRSPLGADEYRAALKRLIVAAAAGMQVMMFAVALYAGDYFGIEAGVEKFLRTISLLVTVPIVFYAARPFFRAAWRGIRAAAPGMDLPVAIAIGSAFTASALATWTDEGQVYFDSVAMFVLFLTASRFLEMRARHRVDDFGNALARLLPDVAVRIDAGGPATVPVDRLRPGDRLRIRPGDVLPCDGRIAEGGLQVDESHVTGESLPVSRVAGDDVLAGTVVATGNAVVEATRTGASTSLAEIGRMLERARAERPPIAELADRIAGRFVVGVLATAAATAAYWTIVDADRAFEAALATLVVTCPCALALATPAAIAAATGRLARRGFLVVRGRILETLTAATVVVFDKTGTLTRGRPAIRETDVLAPERVGETQALAIAAAIETASEHVLARAFLPWLDRNRVRIVDPESVPGRGVKATVAGRDYRLGSAEFAGLQEPDGRHDPATRVFLADAEGPLARFVIEDEPRDDAAATVRRLRAAGMRVVIASGDRAGAVRRIADRLGIDEWRSGLAPAAKLDWIRSLRADGETVLMIGDGINDAPVLAAADGSIALDAGTALARASADAVSLGDGLQVVADAAVIARRTQRVVRQNIAWAIAYNVIALPLAVSGALAPWMAAAGMSASSLVVVLNALRLGRGPQPAQPRPDRKPLAGVAGEVST